MAFRKLYHKIRSRNLTRKAKEDKYQWGKMMWLWIKENKQDIQTAQKGEPCNIGSTRLDYPNTGSIIDNSFINFAKENGIKLKDDDIVEFWVESLKTALEPYNLDLRFDNDELEWIMYNPSYGYCDECGKYVEWDESDGDTEWECSVCGSPIQL